MNNPPTIVVLDDDSSYGDAICSYLHAQGCTAYAITKTAELEPSLMRHKPDLLLMDQRLGDTTGTQILRTMRAHSNLPCIIVSGASDPVDRIVNLEIGADDEIDKSVAPRELLARIHAVLRRQGGISAEVSPAQSGPAQSGWKFVVERRQLFRPDGQECHLTAAEFETLRLLVNAKGQAVSRAVICQRVFGRPHTPEDRGVDTVVKKLRAKIDPPGQAPCIRSVRPTGYVFTDFPQEEGREGSPAR